MPATATPRKPQTLARKLVETRNTSRNRSLAAMLGLGESEKELARDFGSGLNDVIGRGTLASLIGLPGDLGGLAENGIRSALGMPQVQPYGGSEHIGQKLEEAGLVSPVRRPKTELLASLISPSQAASAAYRTPQMARAGVRMLDNLAAPRTMGSQTGAIDIGGLGKMVAPQDEALRVAQQNAAKPIEEGGLGLRPDNTPEERAAAMGFDAPAFHGTGADIDSFHRNQWFTDDPQYASTISNRRHDGQSSNPNVMPVMLSAGNSAKMQDWRLAKDGLGIDGAPVGGEVLDALSAQGFDSLKVHGNMKEAIVFDPRNIRSRFAAFDPMRRDSSDILAGLAPLGLGAWMYQEEPVK